MKSLIGFGLVLVAAVAGEAMAQCSSGQVLNNGTTEISVVTFVGLGNNQSVSAGGLTLSCTTGSPNGPTVATFFDSEANGSSGPAAPTGCSKSGSLNGWSTGARSGQSVTFTSSTPNANVTNITVAGTFSAVATTDGSAGALSALLTGSKVCGRPAAGYPGGAGSPDRWQEQHRAMGKLWDYKLGPGHPIDQEKEVGIYGFTGTGVGSAVTHTYHGSTTIYTWQVYLQAAPNTYSFCSGGVEQVRAFVTAGATGGCASFPLYP